MSDAETEVVKYEEGVVATLSINRPKQLNALNRDVLEQLRAKLAVIAKDERVRFLLLRGLGDKAFVAGADIKAMHAASASDISAFIELGQSVMRDIETLPQVVIAVVDGFALGGGCELALACDLIVASEEAKFGQPEVNLGLIPGFGGTQRLLQRCGIGSTRALVYSGAIISGQRAFEIGLADYLFSKEEFEPGLLQLIDTLTLRGPLAVKKSKVLIRQYAEDLLVAGLKREQESFLEAIASDEAREGMTAFLENRKPVFD